MALLNDSITDYMTFTWPAALDVSSWTMMGWFKLSTVQEGHVLRCGSGATQIELFAGPWSALDEMELYRWYSGDEFIATSSNANLTTGVWYFMVFQLSSLTPKLFLGTLTTPAAELTYTAQTSGSSVRNLSGGTTYLTNKDASDATRLPCSIASFHVCSSALTLAEIIDQQYRPAVRSDSELFILPGLHGTAVPDLSGNGISITVNGMTVTDHIPLGPPFGWDQSFADYVAAGGSTYSETAADGFKIGESIAGEGTFPLTATDGVVLADSLAGALTISPIATDGLTLGDLASAIASMLATGADGFTFGDTSIGGNVFDVSIADGAVFGDTAGASISFSLTATDGLIVGDSVESIGTFPTIVADVLTLSDVAEIVMTIQSAATDGAVFGDLAGLGTTYQVDAADGLTMGDGASSILQAVAEAIDGLIHGDTAEVNCTFEVTAQDGLTLGETTLAVATMLASLTDGIKFSDAASGVTSLPSSKVTVTFTGRKATITFTARKPGVTFTVH